VERSRGTKNNNIQLRERTDMSLSYSRAPHVKGGPGGQSEAPNAALLIDFDNVTMGMRSDLSKELKNLLNSDIIKGKVTVQRAYADWRRYPQYIVPLSENSVDLIFAPAYGSSKKNATDIRMAIDAMELVFIRPEIGTFILLTGDSDFSSVVLKLKEYGKYVIGVGIQESSSDILVQNCDEYYSYTSIAGLRKTTDASIRQVDPWVLVEEAAERMASRDDVMRSDRLKQVMIEIDPSFDEGNFGFSKFSKFLAEAASRDLVKLRKMENGQYEVLSSGGRRGEGPPPRSAEPRKGEGKERPRGREDRQLPPKDRGRPAEDARPEAKKGEEPRVEVQKGDGTKGEVVAVHEPRAEPPQGREKGADAPSDRVGEGNPLLAAYGLLKRALGALASGDGSAVRDSDLKRKMLELEPSFDEGELGFGKFSKFLRQAHDHEVVDLEKREEGTYQVSPRAEAPLKKRHGAPEPGPDEDRVPTRAGKKEDRLQEAEGVPVGEGAGAPSAPLEQGRTAKVGLRLRRGGTRARKEPDGPPPLLEGQVVSAGTSRVSAGSPHAPTGKGGVRPPEPTRDPGLEGEGMSASAPVAPPDSSLDPVALGLPVEPSAMIRYLTNRYKGVGQKTAESLVKEYGSRLFQAMESNPDGIRAIVPPARAEQVLAGWKADLARRQGRAGNGSGSQPRGREGSSGAGDGEAAEASGQEAAEAPGAGLPLTSGPASDVEGRPAPPGPAPDLQGGSEAPPERTSTSTSSRRRTRKGSRGRGRGGSGGAGGESKDAEARGSEGGGLLLDLE
jgi:uncharacterized protein (TIGR00288 family)